MDRPGIAAERQAPIAYATDAVVSSDGTTVGYRLLGHGPGVVLVHGGMQASQDFMALAAALADAFTVYVPDRRGRGLSGPAGEGYGIAAECADIDALLGKTGAHNVFGLSSGALIALHAALVLPAVGRVALYEPPLSVEHSIATDWLPRFDREVAEGNLGAAMVTAVRGTGVAAPLLGLVPRPLLAAMLNRAIRTGSSRRGIARDGDAASVPVSALIPTMHHDAKLVIESEGKLEDFRDVHAEVLLLGGSKSPRFLKGTLDALGRVLPRSRRVELAGVGHLAATNTGRPQEVAEELRRFFEV